MMTKEQIDSGEPYNDVFCYIDGKKCRYGESYFGGIVVEADKMTTKIRSALFGIAVGDALGVPVEFNSREKMRKKPVTDMIGYGTYYQPPGTWSDDSSLAFCVAEALIDDNILYRMGQNFVKWAYESYWTPHGEVFDIGITTRKAIDNLANGKDIFSAGCFNEATNGNGSLMRILPMVFWTSGKEIDERFSLTRQASAITHGHIRSVIACFYYLEFARQIFLSEERNDAGFVRCKFEIYKNVQSDVSDYLSKLSIDPKEIAHFDRLLKSDIYLLPEEKI